MPREMTLEALEQTYNGQVAENQAELFELQTLLQEVIEVELPNSARKLIARAIDMVSALGRKKIPNPFIGVSMPAEKRMQSSIQSFQESLSGLKKTVQVEKKTEATPIEQIKKTAYYQKASPMEKLLLVAQANSGEKVQGWRTGRIV